MNAHVSALCARTRCARAPARSRFVRAQCVTLRACPYLSLPSPTGKTLLLTNHTNDEYQHARDSDGGWQMSNQGADHMSKETFALATWHDRATVCFDIADGPDLKPSYSEQIFAAEKCTVKLIRGLNGVAWSVSGLNISGHRRLKSGALGADVRDKEFGGYRGTIPDWLQPAADAALALINNPEAGAS